MHYKTRVWNLVKKIPKGRVSTYGAIGKKLQMSPRTVGYALHCNKSALIPCHRVVNRNGVIAKNFGMGGASEHRNRLQKEGVMFLDSVRVDLKKHLLQFT